jgi:hypothetical protein
VFFNWQSHLFTSCLSSFFDHCWLLTFVVETHKKYWRQNSIIFNYFEEKTFKCVVMNDHKSAKMLIIVKFSPGFVAQRVNKFELTASLYKVNIVRKRATKSPHLRIAMACTIEIYFVNTFADKFNATNIVWTALIKLIMQLYSVLSVSENWKISQCFTNNISVNVIKFMIIR